jgi:acyl carrier protein
VRRVVAEVLGVAPSELGPAVSLVDDLAADSLDLVEIGLGLEAALGVALPDQLLEGMRTYGDLVAALSEAPAERGTCVETPPATADPRGGGVVEWAAWLTPYLSRSGRMRATVAPADATIDRTCTM